MSDGVRGISTNFHYDWIKKTVERLEERKQRGDMTVEMQVGEFQRILMELLSMHLRCDRMEEMLHSFALYNVPPKVTITKEQV